MRAYGFHDFGQGRRQRDVPCINDSTPVNKQSGAMNGTDNIQQPGLRDVVRIEHQRYTEPLGETSPDPFAIAVSGKTNEAKCDRTEDVGRAGKGQTERLND